MTAAQFRVISADLNGLRIGDVLTLDGAEARHAVRVRRLAVGEAIRCADGAGHGVAGAVESVDPGTATDAAETLTVRVSAVLTQADLGAAFVIAQALVKGGRDELAIEAATELGADEVLAWQADRSVVRWRGDRVGKALTKWQHVVRAAAKQARRLTEPVVDGPLSTGQVADRVRTAVAGGGAAYVLHEAAKEPLAGREVPDAGEVVLVVGPEGGITDRELEALTTAGAMPVRLGDNVLRSSTAGPAALALLCGAGRWRARTDPVDWA